MYSAYESDVSGSYQLLVGRELEKASSLPPPLQRVTIPAGNYLVFGCVGVMPQAVVDGWRSVWSFFERGDGPTRAYTADFEVYRDSQPREIWVAIRPR